MVKRKAKFIVYFLVSFLPIDESAVKMTVVPDFLDKSTFDLIRCTGWPDPPTKSNPPTRHWHFGQFKRPFVQEACKKGI